MPIRIVLPIVCLALPFVAEAGERIMTEFEMGPPLGRHCPVTAEGLTAVESYGKTQPIVGTYFFYWYDHASKAHFVNHDGSDALVDHPVANEGFSYTSAAWWKRELQDVTAAGIDFIVPVYWGIPGERGHWSFVGLPPLVEAWEQLAKEGKRPPRVGLFYDTSTLRHNPQHARVDLSTDVGKRWFYATIRDYFSFIPPTMWAAIDGRPIIVLYSHAFAAKQDPALFPTVRKRFRQDFATDIYLVKNVGWQGEADATSAWGGALGLKLPDVACLGPGYDHHAVPGRKPLVVDREGGAFYSRAWEALLARKPPRRATMVLVETWNELHEGTDVCQTKEYGRQYIELTAKYAALFKRGAVLEKTGPFGKAAQVEWDAGKPKATLGITMPNGGDGLWEATEVDGRPCLRSRQSPHGGKYLYIQLDDSFLFDEADASLVLEVEYHDDGFGTFGVEFDSTDPKGSVRRGAFKSSGQGVRCAGSGGWRRAHITITGGRFANRTNAGDLRLVIGGGDLAVSRVVARRGR